MITISEYLGYIVNQVGQARMMADQQSLNVAKAYASNELMRHFSVPRFKIPELELSIPVSVAKAEFENATKPSVIREDEFLKASKEVLNKAIASYNLPTTPPLNLDNPIFQQTVLNLKNICQQLNNVSIEQRIDIVKSQFQATHRQILAFAKIDLKDKELYVKIDNFIINEMAQFVREYSQPTVVAGKLKDLFINPETQKIKTEASDISVFQIKAKIIEEGVYLNTVKDANGKETKVINFE